MVPATFVFAGLAAWLHFETLGRIILPGVTVWIAWYGTVLLALCISAARSRDDATIAGAVVMVASFVAAHIVWNVSTLPISAQSLRCIAVAGLLFATAYFYHSRALVVAGAAHLAIILFGAAADLGILFAGKRPLVFLAWSFPDVSAGLQHAALIAISFRPRREQASDLGRDYGPGGDLRAAGLARVALPEREKS